MRERGETLIRGPRRHRLARRTFDDLPCDGHRIRAHSTKLDTHFDHVHGLNNASRHDPTGASDGKRPEKNNHITCHVTLLLQFGITWLFSTRLPSFRTRALSARGTQQHNNIHAQHEIIDIALSPCQTNDARRRIATTRPWDRCPNLWQQSSWAKVNSMRYDSERRQAQHSTVTLHRLLNRLMPWAHQEELARKQTEVAELRRTRKVGGTAARFDLFVNTVKRT